MKIEIRHAAYVTVKEQKRMLADVVMVPYYPMLLMSN